MRRLIYALLVLIALASVALFVAWRERVVWAQQALDEALRRAAIPGAAATIAAVELDQLRIRDVTLGTEPIFRADEIVLEAPWPKLRAGRVADVTVREAELRVRLVAEAITLGSLEPWLAAPEDEPASGPPLIPVDRVVLEGVRIAVTGDLGPLGLDVDGELFLAERGRIEAALGVVAHRKDSLIAGRLEATAVHRETGWQGQGKLRIPETTIDSTWLSLAPGIRDTVLGIRGPAAADIAFDLGSEGVMARANLALAGIDLRTPWGRIEGIHGTLQVDGPEPLSTPPGQLLAIRRMDVGLPLLDGLIEFQLHPDGAIDVQSATWHWAGGVLRAAGALQPDAEANEVTLQAEGLELELLLEQAQLEGLTGSGKLAGTLPIFQEGDQIRIEGGRLAATGPGRVRLAPGAVMGAAARQGSQLALVLDVLEDFRFEELSMDLDGDTRGDLDLGVHLKGSNPNFEGGRTVEFNLNLEARLADLVQTGLTAYRLPDKIQERLDSFRAAQEDSP